MSEGAYRLTPAARLLTDCGLIGRDAVAFAKDNPALMPILNDLMRGIPCKQTIGHGESCSVGWYCEGCGVREKSARALVRIAMDNAA